MNFKFWKKSKPRPGAAGLAALKLLNAKLPDVATDADFMAEIAVLASIWAVNDIQGNHLTRSESLRRAEALFQAINGQIYQQTS